MSQLIADNEDGKKSLEDNKVLGIRWNEKDTLIIGVKYIFKNAAWIEVTKRNVLKVIASVYDPVSCLQPIIRLKLLFQETCLLNLGWGEFIGDLQAKWLRIVDEVRKYSDIELKRKYYVETLSDPVDKVYLHGSSDASEMAYGTCI